MNTKRLFIAIDIKPQPALAGFFAYVKKQLRGEAIKWVDENIFHLTLKFLGDTEESKIPAIKDVLAEVCKESESFHFRIEGLGYFGSKHDPRVIFSGITEAQQLKELAERIDGKLSVHGFGKEQKDFKAHLTLGRIKHIGNKPAFFSLIKKESGKFLQEAKAGEIILYESILKPAGPEYIPLFKSKFKE